MAIGCTEDVTVCGGIGYIKLTPEVSLALLESIYKGWEDTGPIDCSKDWLPVSACLDSMLQYVRTGGV